MKQNQFIRPVIIIMILGILSISCSSFYSIFSSESRNVENVSVQEEFNLSETESNKVESANNQETDVEESSDGEVEQEDYPILVVDDAHEFEDFFGLYTYLSDKPLEDVADFYRSEMTVQGYEIEGDVKTSDAIILSLTNGEEIVTINILDNGDGTVTIRYADATP
jgi:hypothetical protein